MIEVRNLSKHFGSHRAVDNISFTVNEGEIVGFLGPNGAGKTTTLRILTCYMPATAGSATIAGYDVLTESMKVRAVVGYLPESVPLYPEMRTREYLRFRGKLHGLNKLAREAAIARVIERCWLHEVIDRPIGQLSRGFRQRVGLADALLHNPRVLVLDEPTVGLDPAQIRATRSLIRELAQEHTVILSSHILPEVEATCQRLIIINEGRLVASGTPDELRERITGQASLIAELKAPRRDVVDALQKLTGVTDVSGQMQDGWTRVNIATDQDVREDIAQLAANKNWPLRELRRDIATLEDFFVKIVAGTR
ncbi:MAG: ATP-binding cassette domain-containing protein [Phycisphaerae bacterium]|nr:ATP-binding cassette domain-containing protein [Phycisphaerae bacterium]